MNRFYRSGEGRFLFTRNPIFGIVNQFIILKGSNSYAKSVNVAHLMELIDKVRKIVWCSHKGIIVFVWKNQTVSGKIRQFPGKLYIKSMTMTINTIKKLFHKSVIWRCWGFLFFSLLAIPPSHAYRVAIFDFDERLKEMYTVAQHIEKRFEDADPQIHVSHFSGKGNEKHSIKVLTSLDQVGYDLIITITSDALVLAHHIVEKTPVLYTNANNPLFLGFRTLEQPGGNISGASYYVSIEDQIRLYKRIYPELTHAGFLFDGENRSRKVELPESRNTCERLGVAYEIEIITLKTELRNAVRQMLVRGVDAVITTSSGKIYQNIETFIDLCNASSIPVFSFNKEGVKQGAVAALASDYYRMVDELILPMAIKVLKEKISPGFMPAAFLQENAVYLNKAQIDRLKLSVPEEISQGANWVK